MLNFCIAGNRKPHASGLTRRYILYSKIRIFYFWLHLTTGSSARGCRIRGLFRTYSTRFMRTRHFHVQLGSGGAKKWPQQKSSWGFPGLYPSKSPYWNVVKIILEPSVCLVCSYWPPGGHMVVGRQPHGGQNEQKIRKQNNFFLKPNGSWTQIISLGPKLNALNGLFGVSPKFQLVSTYTDKEIPSLAVSCDWNGRGKNFTYKLRSIWDRDAEKGPSACFIRFVIEPISFKNLPTK